MEARRFLPIQRTHTNAPSILHPHPSGRRGWNNNVDVPGPKQCSTHIANGNSLTSPTEKAMALHSSTLAWKIPWTEEPGRLRSVGVSKSQTWLSDFTFTFHFYALEKEMATHSGVLAWRIPGMGSHRVGHDWSDLAVAVTSPTCSGGSYTPPTD